MDFVLFALVATHRLKSRKLASDLRTLFQLCRPHWSKAMSLEVALLFLKHRKTYQSQMIRTYNLVCRFSRTLSASRRSKYFAIKGSFLNQKSNTTCSKTTYGSVMTVSHAN